MKREEILSKFHYRVPEGKKIRMIIHTDAKNEADDQYAIVHHLLTPMAEVKGIIAAHFEGKYKLWEHELAGTSMQQSLDEIYKVLKLMKIEDVPVFAGAVRELCENGVPSEEFQIPDSPGADFIIQEAMREDEKPLYVGLMGNLTDLAIAYLKEPAIANRLTAVWIGGGAYPQGNMEFNLYQDVKAAQIVFNSPIPIWQVPQDVYGQMIVSIARLERKVRTCGELGKYLFEQLVEYNDNAEKYNAWPHGEVWSLGDQPTIGLFLQSNLPNCYVTRKAPKIMDDMTYEENPEGKEIRVYEKLDRDFIMDDFYAKLEVYKDFE